jgi:hypothetical protein
VEKQVWHVNIKELWAVSCSSELWAPRQGNHDVAIASDNTAVVFWINLGSARSLEPIAILYIIFWSIASHHMQLKAIWIPSAANVAADSGSRFQFDYLWAFPQTSSFLRPSSPIVPLHPLPYLLPLFSSPHPDIAEAQDKLGLVATSSLQSALVDSTFASYCSAWHAFFRFLLAYKWVAIPAHQELFI